MQPSPMADTSGPLLPSLRFCISPPGVWPERNRVDVSVLALSDAEPDRSGKRLGRIRDSGVEPHLPDEDTPARIAMQRAERGADLHVREPGVSLLVRPFEPLERRVRPAALSVRFRDLIG